MRALFCLGRLYGLSAVAASPLRPAAATAGGFLRSPPRWRTGFASASAGCRSHPGREQLSIKSPSEKILILSDANDFPALLRQFFKFLHQGNGGTSVLGAVFFEFFVLSVTKMAFPAEAIVMNSYELASCATEIELVKLQRIKQQNNVRIMSVMLPQRNVILTLVCNSPEPIHPRPSIPAFLYHLPNHCLT